MSDQKNIDQISVINLLGDPSRWHKCVLMCRMLRVMFNLNKDNMFYS